MRIATIDVGTNTAQLLIADTHAGRLDPVYQEVRFVRLGQGVDATRRVRDDAIERLLAALASYQTQAVLYQAERILIGATSASRDALNQRDLIDTVHHELGLYYEVLSGADEALWSFRAAAASFGDLEGPCATIDIGGGSTEITFGTPDGTIRARHSFDVGSIRLTERFFSNQPPSDDEVAATRRFVEGLFAQAEFPNDGQHPLIGVSGTVESLLFVLTGAGSWDEIEEDVLTLEEVERTWQRLRTLSFDEVLALHPAMRGRADVFPAGVLILLVAMERFGWTACRVTPWGLRHGLALRFMEAPVQGVPR